MKKNLSFPHFIRKLIALSCFIGSLSIYQHIQPNQSYAETQLPNYAQAMTESAIQVSAGLDHTCALTNLGGVKCWGANSFGQLGNNSWTNQATPIDVIGLTTGVKEIAAGGWHTCAVMISGGVKCWGRNDYGQIGDNSKGDENTRLLPVNVIGLNEPMKAIALGYHYSCAIAFSGSLKCWGDRWGNDDSLIPSSIVGLDQGVAEIAAGANHTCVITTDNSVKCWGYNIAGQLGNNTTEIQRLPVNVIGLSQSVNKISANGDFTCAITTIGNVKCWGYNAYGQLGDGSQTNKLTPVDVGELEEKVSSVSLGENHACVLTKADNVKCWGDNQYGQLGNNSLIRQLAPINVFSLAQSISLISSGANHSCAITNSGGIKCWGNNYYGQLGNNLDSPRPNEKIPVDVVGFGSSNSATSIPTFTPISTPTPTPPTLTSTPFPTEAPTSTPLPPTPTPTPIQIFPTPASTNTSYLYISLLANALPGPPPEPATATPIPTPDPCLNQDCREPNNSFTDAKLIQAGEQVLASVNANTDERDIYRIQLQAGKRYMLQLKFTGNSDLDLYLYDAPNRNNDSRVGSSTTKNNAHEQILFTSQSNDQHYVEVVAQQTNNGRQQYELIVTEQ